MRALVKLVAAVLFGTALYATVGGPADPYLDEARFIFRVHAACQSGTPLESPELLEAADQLRARRFGFTPWQSPIPLMSDDASDPSDAANELATIAAAAPAPRGGTECCDALCRRRRS